MNIDSVTFKERIYSLINGDYDLTVYPVPESAVVKNEFEEGCFCFATYFQILDAYSRLCERLQVEEWSDDDVEAVIRSLMAIGQYQAMRMFEYGVFFARGEGMLAKDS